MSNLKLSDIQHTWILHCYSNGLRESTCAVYQQRLERVTSHFPCDDLSNLTIQNILAVFSEARKAGISANTIYGWYRTLRTFGRWVYEQEYTASDPLAKLKAPRTDKVLKKPLPVGDVMRLLAQCQNTNSPVSARDEALMMVALDTGARLAELTNMTLENITDAGAVTLSNTKSRRDRVVFLSAATQKAIRAYLRKNAVVEGALWRNINGEPLTKNGIIQIFKRHGQRIGIKCGPHRWRRTAATGWVEGGADVETVRLLLGHSSLAVTQLYLGLDEKAIQETFAKSTITNRLGKPAMKGHGIAR